MYILAMCYSCLWSVNSWQSISYHFKKSFYFHSFVHTNYASTITMRLLSLPPPKKNPVHATDQENVCHCLPPTTNTCYAPDSGAKNTEISDL